MDEPLVVYEGAGTTSKSWLYADHLGSIVGQANSAGTSTAIYRYGPFGEPDVTTGQCFRYTGQPLIGALGLYYDKARFYAPTLGRFLQTDPIGSADDLNLYAYAGNSPISFSDPSGLFVADAAKLAGKLGDAVDDYVQGGYGRQFAQAMHDGDPAAAVTYFGASFLSIGMTVESGGSSSALRGVAQSAAKGAMWTSTKSKSVAENAFRHFKDHGADFDAKNAVDYVRKAQDFLHNPGPGVLSKTRVNGDVVRFDPATDAFGVMDKTGASRTFYKPDPAKHGYPTNLDYFNAQ